MLARQNPFQGATYLLRGFRMINQPGIRRYVVIPVMVNTVLFLLLAYLAVSYFRDLTTWLVDLAGSWSTWILGPLLWLLFVPLLALLMIHSFVALTGILGSPFYSLMAQRLEERGVGSPVFPDEGVVGILRDLSYTVRQEVYKLLYFTFWLIPFLLLYLIPGLNLLAPFALTAYAAWSLALECLDFAMSNHRIPFSRQRALLKQRRGFTLGFGATALVLSFVPLVNLVIIPAAVAGGVQVWLDDLKAEFPELRPLAPGSTS